MEHLPEDSTVGGVGALVLGLLAWLGRHLWRKRSATAEDESDPPPSNKKLGIRVTALEKGFEEHLNWSKEQMANIRADNTIAMEREANMKVELVRLREELTARIDRAEDGIHRRLDDLVDIVKATR